MIVHDVEQGTPEWHRARAGVITASRFAMLRERMKTGANKGDWKQDARKYAMRLAIERITGWPLDVDEYQPWQGERGHRLEVEARETLSLILGADIEQVGFVTTDCGRFGCSPDGLIGSGGGAEFKAFLDPTKIMAMWLEDDFSEVRDQVQGCMWICERDWWAVFPYHPGLNPKLHREHADQGYIDALMADLTAFDALVESYRIRLADDGTRAPEETAASQSEDDESVVGIFEGGSA
ncbi:YqaJ viral recombinase family protein [Halorhodospira sp. 9622]|uniref:YqaJ viral recombinase family protein n=1 Tax=Halorhodospira sp. 9622 TaxID=2899136 RepID=UPI001EE8169C|nr:YqaJ viral recombinase family protein [Halorhodospira sp. 9622]MCG5537895.1 YqaJ viral recombinase family protein [Halorhodospira sp. 9622]